MKRVIVLLLAALICISYVSAGGKTDSGGTQAPQKETLTVWSSFDQSVRDYLLKFSEKYPEVDLKFLFYEDQDLKIQNRLAFDSGTAPDITSIWSGTMYIDFQKGGYIADITDIINKLGLLNRIGEGFIDPYTTNGRYYAFPSAPLTTWMTLYVNRDLFRKAGITSDPATVSELIAASRKLRAANITPIAIGGKDAFPLQLLTGDFYAQQVASMTPIDAINMGQKKFADSPEFRKAFETVSSLGTNGCFMDGFAALDNVSAAQTFAAGQAAMYYCGSWWPGLIGGLQDFGFNLDVIKLPLIDGLEDYKAVFMASDVAWVVNIKSVDKPAVAKWLDYVTTEEFSIIRAEASNGFSNYPGANAKVKIAPLYNKPAIMDQFKKPALAPFFDMVFPIAVGDLWKSVYQQTTTGQITVDRGLTQIQAEMNKHINTMPKYGK
jgi:ABC-type glycerol-3-phosphate transport system substrate-binding protein